MNGRWWCLGLVGLTALLPVRQLAAAEQVPLGTRRELFVEERLIDRLAGNARLVMHRPEPRELVLETGEPWEANATSDVTVFRDGDRDRMYDRGSHASYMRGRDRAGP